jgi:alpha-mannosidase
MRQHISFKFQIEGNDRRVEYTLLKKAKGGEVIDLWVEMACNGMFGAGKNGLINPPEENRFFCLDQGNSSTPPLSRK